MSKRYPNLIEAGLKAGDVVDGIYGEMTVTSIISISNYRIIAMTETGLHITFDDYGFARKSDARPSIWFKSDTDWFNPPMSPPEPDHMKEFYTDRPVWVRTSCSDEWLPRYAAVYIPAGGWPFIAFVKGKKQAEAVGTATWRHVAYTKPEGAEDHE